MTKENLIELYNKTFDENRNIKNKDQLQEFCYNLNLITGIQCYDARCGLYAYWYSVYQSAVNYLE